jgi:hypothetical protein
MPRELELFGGADDPLSITLLLANLGIGVILSAVLSWHFRRFGSTLSNREEFAMVFPFVLLTTILIISVVKSSLALSLGLVGALSIVRFRTPVKEPEELAYLFIAIAMGLGLGANQTLPTILAGLGILLVMALFKWHRRDRESHNLFLSIDWSAESGVRPEDQLDQLHALIARHTRSSDLRRFETRAGSMEATYLVDLVQTSDLGALTGELRRTFPEVGVTFLDQNRLPGV